MCVVDVGWWALIVSVASLLVSLLTFWRNRWPRPHLVFKWSVQPTSPTESRVDCKLENRGRGLARDVHLAVLKPDTWGSARRAESLAFGESVEVQLTVVGNGSVEVGSSWSEEPHLHKRRTSGSSHRVRQLEDDPDAVWL